MLGQTVVLTSAAAITAVVASRKRRRRSRWVRQFGTFNKFQNSRVHPVHSRWRRSREFDKKSNATSTPTLTGLKTDGQSYCGPVGSPLLLD